MSLTTTNQPTNQPTTLIEKEKVKIQKFISKEFDLSEILEMFEEKLSTAKGKLINSFYEQHQGSPPSLTKKEQGTIQKFISMEKDFEDILAMFGEDKGSEKANLIANAFKKYSRPSKKIPTGRKKVSAKISGKSLPLYWYGQREPIAGKKYFTFLVVGETGTGKTTLLDAFVNCLADMKFVDKWRWKLVDETWQKQAGSKSQTTAISVYHILDERPGKKCNIKLIDTPGFGDTGGMKKDLETVQKFKSLFPNEIEQVDYILLVVKATETRMTGGNRYIFDQIQAMFGKDARDKFVLMLTFADGGSPVALKTLEGALIWQRYFPFNNSSIYAPSSEADSMTKSFWKMAINSVDTFLEFVSTQNADPLSLSTTKEVMFQREFLHERIDSAHIRIKTLSLQIEDLKRIVADIIKNKDQINKNGSYSYTEQVPRTRKKKRSKAITYCTNCNIPCCQVCAWPAGYDQSQCTYFRENGGSHDGCPKCPGKCPRFQHTRSEFDVVIEMVAEQRVFEHKKSQYDQGQSNLSACQILLNQKTDAMNRVMQELFTDMDSVQNSLKKLDELALKPRVFTQNDYFVQMIKFEEETKECGWQERVEGLKEMAERAKTIEKLEKFVSMRPQYMKQLKDAIKQEKVSSLKCTVM